MEKKNCSSQCLAYKEQLGRAGGVGLGLGLVRVRGEFSQLSSRKDWADFCGCIKLVADVSHD